MRRTLLFVITGLAGGGAETQVVTLAVRLAARGWRVTIASLLAPERFQDTLAAGGINVVALGMQRGIPDPRAAWRLARLIRQLRPLVVHSHMVHANLLARVARLLAPFPVLVSTAHSIDEEGRGRELAYRLTDPLADLLTNVSRAAVDRYARLRLAPPGKLRFVPNGVDLARYRRDVAARARTRSDLGVGDAFVWLAVGRFDRAKDYPTMLRAFARCHAAHPDIRLLIAGGGADRGAAEALAAELRIADVVGFLGHRSDVAALVSAADGYVMSSRWEGLPLVLLEAAAGELPVVATAVGGNPEIVLDGRSGHLVPPAEPPALADAMLIILRLAAADRARMGMEGRMHVERRFGLDAVVREWEQVYGELLERRGIDLAAAISGAPTARAAVDSPTLPQGS